MNFIDKYVILLFSTSTILIFIYIALLIRLHRGTKPRSITLFVVLLLISNISFLVVGFTNYELFSKQNNEAVYVWMLGIAQAINSAGFCVVH